MKPVIVGESNPFGGDEYYALYDEPEGCTGDRLCRMVMGLRSETYRRSFERRNLLRGSRWSAPRAREAASVLVERLPESRVWILLGKRVAVAFGFHGEWKPPCTSVDTIGDRILPPKCGLILALPHPSGLNRMWNDPELSGRCRKLLQSVLPEIPFGELYVQQEA